MSPRVRDVIDGFLTDLREQHDDGTIGAATLRQRITFLEDLLTYVDQAHGSRAAAPATALFDSSTCQVWLDAVARGDRRRRATATGNRRGSTATIRAAAASLHALAQWANIPWTRRPTPANRPAPTSTRTSFTTAVRPSSKAHAPTASPPPSGYEPTPSSESSSTPGLASVRSRP
ncbi:hypothetical protein ACWGR4_46110 [Embleya sp. NPDC055664]